MTTQNETWLIELDDSAEFDRNSEFIEDGWWHSWDRVPGSSTRLEAWVKGAAVCRVDLLNSVPNLIHEGAPNLKLNGLYIVYFEVARSWRHPRRGIGTRTIDALTAMYPQCRMFALSLHESAGFWASLGWERFDGPSHHRPLYVQPLNERNQS